MRAIARPLAHEWSKLESINGRPLCSKANPGSWLLIANLKLLAEQPSHHHDLLTSLLSKKGSKADHHFQEVDLGGTGRLITRCEPPSKD